MVRNQFTFYKSFLASARKLKKSSDREKFLMAVIEYALEGKEPENLPENCDVAFSIVLPVLDSSRKKAENASRGGSVSGKQTEANGSKRKQTEANRKQEKEQVKEQEKEKEQVKEQLEQTQANAMLMELWDSYPVTRRGSFEDLCGIVDRLALTSEDILLAAANLEKWKESNEWVTDNGRYIPGIRKWIESGLWRAAPAPARGSAVFGCGGFGEAELEAIQRVLKEG